MKADCQKWDGRYTDQEGSYPEPDRLLTDYQNLLTGGRALDIASGLGANALFLAGRGYWVDAVDISHEALRRLQAQARSLNLGVGSFVADLDNYPLPQGIYEVVVVFYFYAPDLMTAIAGSLKPDGLLVYATYNDRHQSVKPGFNRAYLVPKTGLASYFPKFHVLLHEGNYGEAGNICRLLARKPRT